VRKFGFNPDYDQSGGAEDVIAAGGSVYTPATPTAAASVNISSSSAQDAAGGTGTSLVRVEYISTDYVEVVEEIALTGTTAVNPSSPVWFVNRIKCLDTGSGGSNAGVITIADGSGTFATVPAGFGQTQRAAYMVPAGRLARLEYYVIDGIQDKNATWVSGDIAVRDGLNQAWRSISDFTISQDGGGKQRPLGVNTDTIPPGGQVKVRLNTASADNLRVTAEFKLYLDRV